MRVFYGMAKGNAHRYQCRGDDAHVGAGLCIGIGGVRIDRAVALQILEAVSNRAVEAAIFASDQVERSRKDIIAAVERELRSPGFGPPHTRGDLAFSTFSEQARRAICLFFRL